MQEIDWEEQMQEQIQDMQHEIDEAEERAGIALVLGLAGLFLGIGGFFDWD
ncbi:MAG: hypothetical protein ACR2PR_06155 [Pseudohongiellaceae bacterium]